MTSRARWLRLVLAACYCFTPGCDGASNPNADAEPDGNDGASSPTRFELRPIEKTLFSSNNTLIFPIPLASTEVSDEVLLYTRMTCATEEEVRLATLDARVPKPTTAPAHVTQLEVTQVITERASSDQLKHDTCFVYRAQGVWHPLGPDVQVEAVRGDSPAGPTLTLTADVDLHDVDTIAVFLPIWTTLRGAAYVAEPEP